MNYLVLSDELFPKANANGICLKNILNEIEKQGHSVKYVSKVSDRKHVGGDKNCVTFFYSQLLSWPSCKSFSEKVIYILKRIVSYFKYPRIDKELVEKYFLAAQKIIDSYDIDVIFCVCNPIETVEASVKLKEANVEKILIIYNIDTISDIPFPNIERPIAKYLEKKAYKWEKRTFDMADVIVNLKCHKQHFGKPLYKEYYTKMLYQDIPMLVKPSSSRNKTVERMKTKRLVYAGSFYRTMREPSVLLDLMYGIDGLDYKLSIYTSNSFCGIIQSMLNEASNIEVNGYLKSDELNEVILDSDILISLGNKESNMFPSKIVSYVAFGMPIIHIFQDEMDPVIDYLKPYSNKLLIDNRADIGTNRLLIRDYLSETHHDLEWEKVYAEYKESAPEYCANQIINIIEDRYS